MLADPLDAADLIDAMARRLALAADELRQEVANADAQGEAEAGAEWLAGAKRELDELIGDAWGPPIRGGRGPSKS